MCLAVPARIVSIDGAFAQADMQGFLSTVYIELILNAAVGDYVLVHAGCAIEKIDEAAFNYYNQLCNELYKIC